MIADQTPHAIAAAALGMAERPDSVPDLPGIDAELLRIEGAGHLSNLEAPEAFDTALDGVLTRIDS